MNENNLRFQYFWIISSFELLAAKFEKNSVLNIQEPGHKSLIYLVFFAQHDIIFAQHDIIFIHGFMIA